MSFGQVLSVDAVEFAVVEANNAVEFAPAEAVESSGRPVSGSETYVPVGLSRVDADGREPWESVFDTRESSSNFVIEEATITSEAELLGPAGASRRSASTASGLKRGRGRGAGLSVLQSGLGRIPGLPVHPHIRRPSALHGGIDR